MKNNVVFLFSLVVFSLLLACVKTDDFELPDLSDNVFEIQGDTLSIAAVKSLLAQESGYFGSLSGEEQFSFQNTNKYMVGYVISSDETGNFYQELILQDQAHNPTSGIKIALQSNPLYTQFEIGRKVYVELDGFTIGFSNGVITLGIPQAANNFIDKAPRSFASKIIRSTQKDSIVPLKLKVEDFLGKEKEYQWDNLFIQLEDVQFHEKDVMEGKIKTFAGEAEDYFDAVYELQSCKDSLSTQLITSTFSDFKSLELPQKRGKISGILTKTYNGSAFALKVNYLDNLEMKEERCVFVDKNQVEEDEVQDEEEEEDVEEPEENSEESDISISGDLLFPGADFEIWGDFENELTAGLKPIVFKSDSMGIKGSGALKIDGELSGSGGDFVFEVSGNPQLRASYSKITFYLKGNSDKSLSINLYRQEGGYYKFNLKDIESSRTISTSGANSYIGKIDTQGKWVKITLDLTDLEGVNYSAAGMAFFAVKLGKGANYKLYLDEFRIE